MAISGRAIRAPSRRNSAVSARARRVAAACLAVLMLGACAPSVVKMGKPPLVERLTELRWGESTAKDVVAVLGEPQGRGAARSTGFGLKDAWLYESVEVEGAKARMRMLMVFLDKETGVYHGHMWMASGMLVTLTKE